MDDSSKRDYYLSLIQLHIVQSIEELEFIKAEMPLVKMMEAAKIGKYSQIKIDVLYNVSNIFLQKKIQITHQK